MLTTQFTQVKETCLYFADLELARHFYHEKLGLPIISFVENKHVFFRTGSSVLLCFNPNSSSLKKSPPAHYSSGKYHFALEVEANIYERAKKEIESMDIAVIDEVTWENGQKSFYFNDPIGNVLEIVPKGIWD
jgi:catechol 2,3-dioxygenase-like lactoylglutathione lyase family enzyme